MIYIRHSLLEQAYKNLLLMCYEIKILKIQMTYKKMYFILGVMIDRLTTSDLEASVDS